MTRKVSIMDLGFWITESRLNPKHVAGVFLMKKSQDISVAQMTEQMRHFKRARAPFNWVMKTWMGLPLRFEIQRHLDMDYHVQYHSIADVGNKVALDQMVARLHEVPLDNKRPLWQLHIIDSPKGDEFAGYIKLHHAVGDGASAVRWLLSGMQSKPVSEGFSPFWAKDKEDKKRKGEKPKLPLWKRCVQSLRTGFGLSCLMLKLGLRLFRINPLTMPLPFSGKKTVLTGQVTAGREFTRLDLPLEPIRQIGRKARATVNEVLLTVIDMGVRRYLEDYGHDFDKPLISHMPINLREHGDRSTGNKIGIALVELAHGSDDPFIRLRQVVWSHSVVRKEVKQVSSNAFVLYTFFWQGIALLMETLRISEWVRPLGNILISNVPGPQFKLYFRDCEITSLYPASTLTPGGGANFTMFSYNGMLNIGVVCCNKNICDLAPLQNYVQQAFVQLQRAVDSPDGWKIQAAQLPEQNLKEDAA